MLEILGKPYSQRPPIKEEYPVMVKAWSAHLLFSDSIFKGHVQWVEINSHLPKLYNEQNHVKQEFKEWVPVSSEINHFYRWVF